VSERATKKPSSISQFWRSHNSRSRPHVLESFVRNIQSLGQSTLVLKDLVAPSIGLEALAWKGSVWNDLEDYMKQPLN